MTMVAHGLYVVMRYQIFSGMVSQGELCVTTRTGLRSCLEGILPPRMLEGSLHMATHGPLVPRPKLTPPEPERTTQQLPRRSGAVSTRRPLQQTMAGAASPRPLEPPLRRRFEERLDENLHDVRVHRGPAIDEAVRAEGALAATLGRDIAVSSAVSGFETPEGAGVLAHELVHVAQQAGASGPMSSSVDPSAEREAQIATPSALLPGPALPIHRSATPSVMFLTPASGQQSASPAGQLTADLTSPVVVGREVLLQSDISPTASFDMARLELRGPYPYYRWKVFDRLTKALVAEDWSATNHRSIAYPRVGQFRVECVLMDPSRGASPSVTIEQDAIAEDPALAGSLSSNKDYGEAERELVDDFGSYVQDAALGTGTQGVTARFVAAILREEIANTAFLPSWLGPSNKASRANEISGVSSAIARRAAGQSVDVTEINKSIGVGQLRLSTAAMSQGLIPWIEQNPRDKGPARAQIQANFSGLKTTTLADLRDLLAWPKSNIKTVASTLERLKNRSNRYPSLTRSAFGSNQRACEIIATEYNIGATNSPESAANASDYGRRIWGYMSLPILRKFFPNT